MINIHLPYLLSKISPQISKDFSQIYLPYMCNTFMCNLFKMFNFSNVFVSILNCILWGESSSIKCVHIAANILDQIAKIVLTEFEMYLSNQSKYLLKFSNVFVNILKCILWGGSRSIKCVHIAASVAEGKS